MKKLNARSNRIDPDYTEELVGFVIESFLTSLSFPRRRFTLEPFSKHEERSTGADARLTSRVKAFQPFYMQFKRPFAYPDFSNPKIIKDRKKLKLTTMPRALYFQLRDKRPTHADYQHNILFNLRERLKIENLGDAAYICPLFMKRDAYRLNIYLAGLSRWPRFWIRTPWDYEERLLHSESSDPIDFRIPIFAEHIAIPPHATVSSAKHSYSFTESGSELCFHSPLNLPERSDTLVSFLKGVQRKFLEGEANVTMETANQVLNKIIGEGDDENLRDVGEFTGDGNPILNWLAWGDFLRRTYDIHQYAFVKWNEE